MRKSSQLQFFLGRYISQHMKLHSLAFLQDDGNALASTNAGCSNSVVLSGALQFMSQMRDAEMHIHTIISSLKLSILLSKETYILAPEAPSG
jgi:hypothetical protein